MNNLDRTRSALRWSAAAVVLLAWLPAYARLHKSEAWADTQFAAAARLQEGLEGQPAARRTRNDYERVINAYRLIYFSAPTSTKADPSVVTSAQLMEEMGRLLGDDEILRSAIHQYEFLRRQYPGSKARFGALFRIGEIYKEDLHDKAKADAAFAEFLHRYPRNPLAAEAQKALSQPVQQAGLRARESEKEPSASDADSSEDSSPKEDSANQSQPEAASGGTSRVLGIRHWSTPEYTRVAIDLEQGVKYEAQRIDHPDRVFFDLYKAKLDRKLIGTSLDVGDGFLKKIRISQFKTEQARIVLDLDELTDYQASLLKNPPRLIIDIRNRQVGGDPVLKSASIVRTAEKKPDAASAKALVADVAENTGTSTAGDLSEDVAADTYSPAEQSKPEQAAVSARSKTDKPAGRTTVVNSNGVKKTIVDADDNDDTVAKLDVPEIKPASKSESTLPAVGRVKSTSRKGKRKTPGQDLDVREAQPTASGDRSLIRALGLKIGKIVIDPGHGGHDTGTIGPNGLEEKDLVLDVSRRLGKLLETRLGASVVYTRKDDTFIPLEDRTAIANQEGADLFVSVHANSSHDPDARGVETYYLNFTSSPEALEVAARENAVSEKSIHELQDLVKKIALKEKIEESHEFASDVQSALHSGLAAKSPGLRDRGVKKAPFIVLIGANMPSILAEISFVSNPGDEHRLETSAYRQRIAESLYRGIAKYVGGLSGVKVASKIEKDEGQ